MIDIRTLKFGDVVRSGGTAVLVVSQMGNYLGRTEDFWTGLVVADDDNEYEIGEARTDWNIRHLGWALIEAVSE